MAGPSTPPQGPRGAVGAAAESAAARHVGRLGWTVIGRNVRVGRDEIDILALEPGPPPVMVVLEVRSKSSPRFGVAVESVDRRKVQRLYRAALTLQRTPSAWVRLRGRTAALRVDLLALSRDGQGDWRVDAHVRGLEPM